ncbi:MAG TPA: carbamate kinase [Streptosporangiaceae bacterium]|nr:carbamate kinase [Streptosporangiaceae bacterium]
MRVLIALGGNAMTGPNGEVGPKDQQAAIELAVEPVADLVASGAQVVMTHGNGPQVGNLLLKNELAAAFVPAVPLDWCGAQTQGSIGTLILNALDRALAHRGLPVGTAVLVSRTLVAADDEHFSRPSKPVGPYRNASEASTMVEAGQLWQDCGQRGWRRLVASPEPLECLEARAAAALLAANYVVVCAGGGGVPVIRDGDELRGVEAVVDKDLAAAVLARQLDVDRLVIATDVDGAFVGWGTRQAAGIGKIGARQLRDLAADGHFADGSMGPKVEAACRFAELGGRSVITSLRRLASALRGTAGTIVEPS